MSRLRDALAKTLMQSEATGTGTEPTFQDERQSPRGIPRRPARVQCGSVLGALTSRSGLVRVTSGAAEGIRGGMAEGHDEALTVAADRHTGGETRLCHRTPYTERGGRPG